MTNCNHFFRRMPLLAFVVLATFCGCKTEDETLAPYISGGRVLSPMTVQDSVFIPKVTWLGGYVTAFGVNRGTRAILDTSLVWLVYSAGNSLHYPITFGTLPPGAQDLTAQYGGTSLARLKEDNTYTFWILKEDAWNQVASISGKQFLVDTTIGSGVRVANDSVWIGGFSHAQFTRLLDVYINIKSLTSYGRLGTIDVIKSDSSNSPTITFKITQSGVTDTMISAIGVVLGGMYQVNNRVWEVISADVRPDTTIYWKNNVISSPLHMGQQISNTEAFVSYPPEGLTRGASYYLWIANKNWDQVGRSRSTPNYAFATFTVW
jgi:hypothetical protein